MSSQSATSRRPRLTRKRRRGLKHLADRFDRSRLNGRVRNLYVIEDEEERDAIKAALDWIEQMQEQTH